MNRVPAGDAAWVIHWDPWKKRVKHSFLNENDTLTFLYQLRPLGWLAVLLAVYFCGERRWELRRRRGLPNAVQDEVPPNYKALGIFAALRLCCCLVSPLFTDRVLPLGLSVYAAHRLYLGTYWTLNLLSFLCVFFVLAALLRNSLKSLPGLSAAAMIVFRWTAIFAVTLTLTAHLPIFGIHSFQAWLSEMDLSFALCMLFFEATMLVLFVMRLERLGMCLRSRSVGLALGLTVLGAAYLLSAITSRLPGGGAVWLQWIVNLMVLGVLAMWVLYVVAPEPRRHTHALAPSSKLMRWNEIALKLELGGRASEPAPFISGVQLIVDGILDKYRIGEQ